ncbi:hypothetical protein GCM10023149_35890 [Mucilaginibacter gynuensis]|uniref:Uncharacterized protein n=2 Tax=Mucilaginibacter gynuensis TaxID=1302236 RepID=A0ABP8GVZ2_9SPHI
MVISIAPAFLCLDNKAVSAVILQLENETKSEKESPDKDAFKDKKAFDEFYTHHIGYKPLVAEANILHNMEKSLYKKVYFPTVATPPPNV